MTAKEAVIKRIEELCRTQKITYYTLAYRSAIPNPDKPEKFFCISSKFQVQ